MARRTLPAERVHPGAAAMIDAYHPGMIDEVEAAVQQHSVVVVGMKQNPFPKKARKLLDEKGVFYHYLEYGSYWSGWKARLALKMWAGWPTFPMVFAGGKLVGGFDELAALVASGELEDLLTD